MAEGPVELTKDDLANAVTLLVKTNNLANWRTFIPPGRMSDLFPMAWFDHPQWVQLLIDEKAYDFESNYPLCCLIKYITADVTRMKNDNLISLFHTLLSMCKSHLNDLEGSQTPLAYLVLRAIFHNSPFHFHEYFPDFVSKLLVPLLDAGASPDARCAYYPDACDTIITVFIMHFAPWKDQSSPTAHVLIWLLRYSAKFKDFDFEEDGLVYLCQKALTEEIDMLMRAKSTADLPAFVLARAQSLSVHDADALPEKNPFRHPYANLLTCIRRANGFPTDCKNMEALPLPPLEHRDERIKWETRWLDLVTRVRTVNYLCQNGHVMRSIYYEQADGEDMERQSKKSKMDE